MSVTMRYLYVSPHEFAEMKLKAMELDTPAFVRWAVDKYNLQLFETVRVVVTQSREV